MGKLPTLLIALLLLPSLLVSGCGGDDSESGSSDGSPSAEIETTIKTWMTSGGCELMTDDFLEDQTFIDEPAEACEAHENLFEEPSYGEDEIIVSDIEISGNTASAVISDDFSNVETTYRLKLEGGSWKIDSADIN